MKADVIIIGAGPAGLSAAIGLARRGVSVVIVDEYYMPGGRLLGQYYEDPNLKGKDKLWNGKEIANNLAKEAEELGVNILCSVSVWRIQKRWKVDIIGHSTKVIEAPKLIVATGSAEKSLAIKGWTLPGVYSIGAAQTFTNLHEIALGKQVMIVGTDPLALSVFMEMKDAGINVVSVVLPPKTPIIEEALTSPISCVSRLSSLSDLAPNPLLKKLGRVISGRLLKPVTKLLRFNLLRIKGTPIQLRKAIVSIGGDSKVEYVYLQNITIDGKPIGKKKKVEVDTVCLSSGLYPLVDVVKSLDYSSFVDISDLGGVVPLHAKDMATKEKGLYVAGNITGIEGAKVAMAQGRLSAVSILESLNLETEASVEKAIQDVKEARNSSPIKFIPTVEKGRQKMNELWKNNQEGRIS